MSKIVVTDEMITAGYDAADGEIGPANVETIYRTMAALDPSRRAPSVTREEIEKAVWANVKIREHENYIEGADFGEARKYMTYTIDTDSIRTAADAILALLRGE